MPPVASESGLAQHSDLHGRGARCVAEHQVSAAAGHARLGRGVAAAASRAPHVHVSARRSGESASAAGAIMARCGSQRVPRVAALAPACRAPAGAASGTGQHSAAGRAHCRAQTAWRPRAPLLPSLLVGAGAAGALAGACARLLAGLQAGRCAASIQVMRQAAGAAGPPARHSTAAAPPLHRRRCTPCWCGSAGPGGTLGRCCRKPRGTRCPAPLLHPAIRQAGGSARCCRGALAGRPGRPVARRHAQEGNPRWHSHPV